MQWRLLCREKTTTKTIARICNKEVHDGGKQWNLQQKRQRFYTFTLAWNWIWLAFSLWNWKKRVKRVKVSGEAMWMHERGTGTPRMLTLEACFHLLTKKTLQIFVPHWGLETDFMFAKKAKKLWKELALLIFSLSGEFKTKKKWKCAFSNQHRFLLQGRIRLILKAFLYPKFFLSFHDLIIQNI